MAKHYVSASEFIGRVINQHKIRTGEIETPLPVLKVKKGAWGRTENTKVTGKVKRRSGPSLPKERRPSIFN